VCDWEKPKCAVKKRNNALFFFSPKPTFSRSDMSAWSRAFPASSVPAAWVIHTRENCCGVHDLVCVSLRALRAQLPGCVVRLCNDDERQAREEDIDVVATEQPMQATAPTLADEECENVTTAPSPQMVKPASAEFESNDIVFLSKTGSCYHSRVNDAGKHPSQTTRGAAEQNGKVPCRRCYGEQNRVPTPSDAQVPTSSTTVSSPSSARPVVSSSLCVRSTRIVFYDLEANSKKNAHQTRQMAVRSLDGNVVWSRDIDGDFGAAWAECEAVVDPTGRDRILMFAHNGRCFDVPILTREFRTWGITVRDNWTFCDSLPYISKWLRGLKTGRAWKCSTTNLTHSLLRSSVKETNASLVAFWSATPFTTKASAHEAAFDCLVLRSIFVMAFASHLLCDLTTRNDIVSVDAIEQAVRAKLEQCVRGDTLDELMWQHMSMFS